MSVESAGNQSNEINGDELKEYITLCTRAGTYQVNTEQESSGSNTTHSTPIASKKDFRHKHFLKCKNHCLAAPKWTKDNDECANCILFNSSPLPKRRLPTVKDVICYYFYLRTTPAYHHQAADQDTTTDIMNHWISCNVLHHISEIHCKKSIDSSHQIHIPKGISLVKEKRQVLGGI